MKDLTLGKKINLSFAALLAIAFALGSLAIEQMRSVGTGVRKVANQYVPEVGICSDMGIATLTAMLAIRSFGYTGEATCFEQNKQAVKPAGVSKSTTRKPAWPANEHDIPMPEPLAAPSGSNGFHDF